HMHSQSHPRLMNQVKRAAQSLAQNLLKKAPSDNPTRWVDVLSVVVGAYNNQWNHVINNTPVGMYYARRLAFSPSYQKRATRSIIKKK
ncbi:hypothetical protein NEHOM01_2542, partial [Nematocida homosporus]|uniref:uncharacterized protein n=1 Tax=Nematocida homosporus TaxID=1912981 RepID=UPI00221EBCE6